MKLCEVLTIHKLFMLRSEYYAPKRTSLLSKATGFSTYLELTAWLYDFLLLLEIVSSSLFWPADNQVGSELELREIAISISFQLSILSSIFCLYL